MKYPTITGWTILLTLGLLPTAGLAAEQEEPADQVRQSAAAADENAAAPDENAVAPDENAEASDTLIMAMLAVSNSRQGLQQNTDMRKIAAYAAMLGVPTALAGIYGMNFDHMPELHWAWGYPMVLGLMGLALVLMYRAFKRSGWL